MPRKKFSPKGGSVAVRMRENTRLMHTHESMVDYLHGQTPMGSFLNVFAPNFFGLNFARPVEDNLIYSDEYDDDDDYDDDDWCPPFLDNRPRSPSIQIKELTDQEAEEIYEKQRAEEQRKNRTERNKRKKIRKKEKKRLEKENTEKEDIPEEEEEESVLMPKPLETPLENPKNDSKAESNESNTNCHSFPIQTVRLGADESSGNNDELKTVEKNKKEDLEKKESHLKLSSEASSVETVPEKKCNKKLPKVKKRERDKPPEVQKNDKENAKIMKKPEVHQEEETHTIAKEKSVDPSAEEFARRSIELAGLGNRFAALSQFEMAVTYFTDAIKFNPTEYKLFGNRSLCYERLEQYENALSDADVALFMQPNWIKGLFRKGKALFGLKRYYEASLVYKEVLQLESSSAEAAQELKRAHTLHLMEMGFSWSQSSDALKTHVSLEAALDALFIGENNPLPQENSDNADQPALQEEEDDEDGEWTVLQSTRLRMQRDRKFDGQEEKLSIAQPMPQPKSLAKTELFPVWVGTLRPSMTYMKLRDIFNRAGTVYSIKMLLEQECALVNFSNKEDSERAIQYLNGVVVDGASLSVRHPSKVHTGFGASKECFFWRTTGCTEPDCTYKHIPKHKNMDRERFTNRLGNAWNLK